MGVPDKYEKAKAEITAIYHENKGRYGYRRITTELRSRRISPESQNCAAAYEGTGLSLLRQNQEISLLQGRGGRRSPPICCNRDFQAEKPNQKWVTDVTEFSLFGQKLYLSPDPGSMHSRYLVSYTISRPTCPEHGDDHVGQGF